MSAKDRATRDFAAEVDAAPWPGEVLGENLRQIREEQRLTQREAARKLGAAGLNWSASTIATVEARAGKARREVSVGELALLAKSLDVAPGRFFEGSGHIRLSEAAVVTRADFRTMLAKKPAQMGLIITGSAVGERALRETLVPAGQATDTDHIAAREVGQPVEWVVMVAGELWGHGIAQERDHRIGKDLNRLSKESLRARRGQVTRELINELRAEFARRAGSKKRGRR